MCVVRYMLVAGSPFFSRRTGLCMLLAYVVMTGLVLAAIS